MSAAEYGAQPGGLLEPDARADHATWARYAVSQGMPTDQAAGLTRDQIRVRFVTPGRSIGGEPDLDVLERDPETRAGRRAAQRPAWER